MDKKDEKSFPNVNHWSIPLFRERMTRKQWQQILLQEDDKICYRGELVQLKAKNLGFGVVEVYKDLPIEPGAAK
jgi:hypothetical protein